MIEDKFGNPIYQASDLFNSLYKGYSDFSGVLSEDSIDIQQFERFSGLSLKKIDPNFYDISIEDFDRACQEDWFIPKEYKNMDIEGFLVDRCPKENYQRLIEELQEYRSRNLLDLLRVLKYLVDTFRKNNILWGVGRGSSVASYVLYLLEVHRIDSVKYNLDWREFLR
jgi:DNA polymerase III alpha subunit